MTRIKIFYEFIGQDWEKLEIKVNNWIIRNKPTNLKVVPSQSGSVGGLGLSITLIYDQIKKTSNQ